MADDHPGDGETPRITIHTDGSASPQTRTGGWAFVMTYQGRRLERRGSAENTTNNRMELTAAIEALAMLPRRFRVTLVSDSRYLVDAFEKRRLERWRRRGWSLAHGGSAKNVDLWERLSELVDQHDLTFRWVRSHSGDVENERCDRLARAVYV